MPAPFLSQQVPDQETWLSRAAGKYLWDPAMRALESPNTQALLDAIDQTQRGIPPAPGIGLAKPMLAMIPTIANLPKFMEKMKAAKGLAGKFLPEAELAAKYLQARYPKRGSLLAENAVVKENPFAALTRVQGNFDPEPLEKGLPSINTFTHVKSAPTMTGTQSHETQHLIDYMRAKERQKQEAMARLLETPPPEKPLTPITVEEFIPEEEGGKYLTFTKHGMEKYKNQPVEARAFKAGGTAQKGFEDFMNMATGARKNPVLPEFAPIRSPKTIDRFEAAVKNSVGSPQDEAQKEFLAAFETEIQKARRKQAAAQKYQEFKKKSARLRDVLNATPKNTPEEKVARRNYFSVPLVDYESYPTFQELLPAKNFQTRGFRQNDPWSRILAEAAQGLGYRKTKIGPWKLSLSEYGAKNPEDQVMRALGILK